MNEFHICFDDVTGEVTRATMAGDWMYDDCPAGSTMYAGISEQDRIRPCLYPERYQLDVQNNRVVPKAQWPNEPSYELTEL